MASVVYDAFMSRWQLYIRHAHRDTSDRSMDNGLSSKGHEQGRQLAEHLASLGPQYKPQFIYSSPKRRCIETANWVAQWAGIPVEEDERLDEQNPSESDKTFFERIQDFVESEKHRSKVAYCSHGDVLPLIAKLCGFKGRDEVKKGEIFWIKDGRVEGLNSVHSSGV
jgi:broad specificity phosphatase PhoE